MKPIYRTINLRPNILQFVINELPLLSLCPIGLLYGGIEEMPFQSLVVYLTLILTLLLVYRFIYIRRVRYHIESEQLVYEHGILQRKVDYVELYRVVDFKEHQSLMQQIAGLKTVTIFSGDRTSPRMDLMGMVYDEDIVSVIRERVEFNKQRKGVYEITNR